MLNYRKHNLWRAFVDFLFDNDENKARVQNHTLFITKMGKTT